MPRVTDRVTARSRAQPSVVIDSLTAHRITGGNPFQSVPAAQPSQLDAQTELAQIELARHVRRNTMFKALPTDRYISPGELLKRIRSLGDTSTPQQLHAMINTLLREGAISALRGEFRLVTPKVVTHEPQ